MDAVFERALPFKYVCGCIIGSDGSWWWWISQGGTMEAACPVGIVSKVVAEGLTEPCLERGGTTTGVEEVDR